MLPLALFIYPPHAPRRANLTDTAPRVGMTQGVDAILSVTSSQSNATTLWFRDERHAPCSTHLSSRERLIPQRGEVWELDSGVLLYANPIQLQIGKRFKQHVNLWEADEEIYWKRAFADVDAACSASASDATCTVLDVGAAYGYYSILSRLHTPPAVQVHAFNPHPSFMRDMRQNLMLNRVDGSVCLHELAVSNQSNAKAALSYSVASGIRQKGFHEHGKGTALPVNTTSLDEWAAAAAPWLLPGAAAPLAFLLVKLDIEGAAELALKGAWRLMSRATHIFIGIHDTAEWDAVERTFDSSRYEILVKSRSGDGDRRPNGAFIARARSFIATPRL
uniref:Methyltransferase FkbM domain-containing protein n=1 Tax=Haptolina ericina TaxID=156174 RepID=A0A7S3EY87_9EUKA